MKEVFYTFVVGVFLATSSVPVMAVLKDSDESKDVASGSSSALQQVLVRSTLDGALINLGAQGEAVDKKSYFKRMIEIIRNPHASIQGFIQGLKSFFFPRTQIESTTSSLQEGKSCGATEIFIESSEEPSEDPSSSVRLSSAEEFKQLEFHKTLGCFYKKLACPRGELALPRTHFDCWNHSREIPGFFRKNYRDISG